MQGVGEVVQSFKTSVETSNTELISDLFDDTVELTVEDNHSNYSKGHAQIILNEFYKKIQPKKFTLDYTSNAPHTSSQYLIGTLLSTKGKYKVYLFIAHKEGKRLIQEMKITKI
jgi:hypothetical protein